MRREQHLRTDPFGLTNTPQPVENPVDNSGAHLGAHPTDDNGAHPTGTGGRTPVNPNEINGAHNGAHSGAPSESKRGAPRRYIAGRTEDHAPDTDLNNLF